jgi:hypothetical protein
MEAGNLVSIADDHVMVFFRGQEKAVPVLKTDLLFDRRRNRRDERTIERLINWLDGAVRWRKKPDEH